MMKFQFDATQQYQLDAVASIVDIFKGQQRKSVQYSVIVGGGSKRGSSMAVLVVAVTACAASILTVL